MSAPMTMSWWDKMRQAAQDDPKKAVILAALVVVMLGLWAKVMLGQDGGPCQAIAAPTLNARELAASGASTRPSHANAALQDWLRSPLGPLDRNLFAVKLDYFPQDASKALAQTRPAQDSGFWDQLAKSMASQADQQKEKQVLLDNLQVQAAQLRLQTTLMGAQPKALINGDLVKEGDVVASFRVLKIESRRVILEREGIRLEVLMK